MTEAVNLAVVMVLRDQALAGMQQVKAAFAAQFEVHAETLKDCEQYIALNLDQLGPEGVLARKFAVEDDMALLASPTEDATKALGAAKKACEQYMHAHLTSKNLQNMKLSSGPMAFLQKGSSASVFDWESVLDSIINIVPAPDGVPQETWDHYITYLRAQGNWQLLKKDVSKTAVAEIVDAKGVPPEGIKYETYQTVQFRRGSGK